MATEQHATMCPDGSTGVSGEVQGVVYAAAEAALSQQQQQQQHVYTSPEIEKTPPRTAPRPLLGIATPREDDTVISLSPNTAAAAVATANKAAGVSNLFGPATRAAGMRQQNLASQQQQQQTAKVLGPAEMAIWAVEAALLRRTDSSQC
jgi:hypothetical protein